MPRLLSLWLPRWPIQRWAAARAEHSPRTASAPIVHYREQAQRGLRVVDCCPTAARLGVRAGMPLTEAMSLARRGDADRLQTAVYDPAADLAALRQLALACEPFSPQIGLDDLQPPAGLLLDVTSLDRLFGGEQELARRLAEHLRQRGYYARIAIADTIGRAWGLSHFGPQPIICLAHAELSRSEQLPVAALRLPAETIDTLHRLGIERVEQLLALPRRELRSRFGPELLTRLWQWQGELPELIRPVEQPLEIEASTALEYTTTDLAAVSYLVGELLRKIVAELAEHRLGATQLECCLQGETGPPVVLRIGFCFPSDDPAQIGHLLQLQLEGVLLPQGVNSIRLRVAEHAPHTIHQTELFSHASTSQSRELIRLLDLLCTRLGQQQVLGVQLREDYQPERAYSTTSVADAAVADAAVADAASVGRARKHTADAGSIGHGTLLLPGTRPLVLVDPPEPIHDLSLDRCSLPREFVYRQQRQRVASCTEPEMIETGWWRGETVRRAYHRVETADGSMYWLYRRLDDDVWFLQGEFL